MYHAYNFVASWQLIPEQSSYEQGDIPTNCYYKIERIINNTLSFTVSYNHFVNGSFTNTYQININENWQIFDQQDFADEAKATTEGSHQLVIEFKKADQLILTSIHEILKNGYLAVTHNGLTTEGAKFINKEVYHKQLMVLPYSNSASGVAIRPTKEGIIKHKALSAMEEQTNMQLNQIKEQVELLMRQANEIKRRKELSLMIYEAKLNFKPQIGQTYYLYKRKDETNFISLVAPQEWGASGPFKEFLSKVQLMADHTWREL
jgi:hypothetical protein